MKRPLLFFLLLVVSMIHPALGETKPSEKVQTLIQKGDSFYNQGSYDVACSLYEEAYRIDPADKTACKRMERIEKIKFKAATTQWQAERQNALNQATSLWSQPPPAPSHRLTSTTHTKTSRVPQLLKKLESLRLPELNFQSADAVQVVQYLSEQSRKIDPEGKGVNFVFEANAKQTSGETFPPQCAPITLSLHNVSLLDALDLIKKTTALNYQVEDYAVVLKPFEETDQTFLVRHFTVSPDFFHHDSKPHDAALDVKQQLTDKGVPLTEGSTASYFPNTSQLVVRGAADTMQWINRLVTLEQTDPPQVQIETKFIEFTEDKMEELRLRWQVSMNSSFPALAPFSFPAHGSGVAGQTGGVRGIRTDGLTQQAGISQNALDRELGRNLRQPNVFDIGGILDGNGARLLIELIHSVAGGNLMSAPKITLKKGGRGTVRIAQEFIYPRHYSPPTIQNDEDGTVVPSNPEDFNFDSPKNVGVSLRVMVQEINPESRLIDLKLEDIEVVEFDGFIDYGNAIVTTKESGEQETLAQSSALQPVFSTRRASADVQLMDGQTLVIGGFIRDDVQKVNDKVPVLGDVPLLGKLFQSKSDQTVKRNLIIMSTASLLNLDGCKNGQSVAANNTPLAK